MHTQQTAVSSLLLNFQLQDFAIRAVNDGEENFCFRKNKNKFSARKEATEIICSVDQAWVRVEKDDKLATLFIVLGNDDSEILCDYSASSDEFMQEIEVIAEKFYQQWEKA